MWTLLFFIDQWILCAICDPIVIVLCRLMKMDHFECARIWWHIIHGSLLLWGVYLCIVAECIMIGSMIIVWASIVFAITSRSLWRILCHKCNKPTMRHPYEKELSEIKYRIYTQGNNPLTLAQSRVRIYNVIDVIFFMPLIGYMITYTSFSVMMVLWKTVFVYNCCYVIYLYIRASTNDITRHA